MTKQEFLTTLENHLQALPRSEIDKTLAYYSEIIDDRMEEGMSEAEVVGNLGTPEAVARQIIQDMPIASLIKERTQKKRSIAQNIVLICTFPLWMPLLLALLSVIFALYMAFWAVVVALFAVVFSMVVAGLAVCVAAAFAFPVNVGMALACLGAGLILLGIGMLLLVPVWAASKGILRLLGGMFGALKARMFRKAGEKHE